MCLVVAERGRPKIVAMEADRVRRVIDSNRGRWVVGCGSERTIARCGM